MTEKTKQKAKKAFSWSEHGAALFGLVSLVSPDVAQWVHVALGLASVVNAGIQP